MEFLKDLKVIQLGSSGKSRGVPCSLLLMCTEEVAGTGEGRLIRDTGVAPEATPHRLGKEGGKEALQC